MEKKLAKIVLAILFCFVCVPVQAEMITIAITGQVTGVEDQYGHLENKIHVGDSITGTYIYDSIASGPPYDYYSNPCGISLYAGGFNFKTDQNNVHLHISVINNDLLGYDGYSMTSYNNLSLSNGALVESINWQLEDTTGTALSSDALPLTAPDLSRWNSNLLRITHDRDFTIDATVTSAVLIPEPATVFLFSLGIFLAKRKQLN
jgi:hypothetical protein